MDTFEILVVGRGKLAEELLQGLQGPAISRVVRWGDRGGLEGGPSMIVHAGSGRELGEAIEFCSSSGSTLLNLSTGDAQFPSAPDFPLVLCPNVNMPMLRFMAMVKQAARHFRGQGIRITESHQSSKRTKPGTAIHLANSLGVPENEIRSVRDPKVQHEALGIPTAFLDRHAYHEVAISDPDVEIRLETRVLGKSAYASGLAKVIEIVAASRLQPGCFDVVDLVMHESP